MPKASSRSIQPPDSRVSRPARRMTARARRSAIVPQRPHERGAEPPHRRDVERRLTGLPSYPVCSEQSTHALPHARSSGIPTPHRPDRSTVSVRHEVDALEDRRWDSDTPTLTVAVTEDASQWLRPRRYRLGDGGRRLPLDRRRPRSRRSSDSVNAALAVRRFQPSPARPVTAHHDPSAGCPRPLARPATTFVAEGSK